MFQSFIDQLKIRHLDLLRVLNESSDSSVTEKTELTLGDWDRILSDCKRRKTMLNQMISESRTWEQVKCSVQLWLTEAQQRFGFWNLLRWFPSFFFRHSVIIILFSES